MAGFAGRCVRLLLVIVAVMAGSAVTQAAWAAPYAAIVMDMRNGEVLYARSADRRQPPASLTKLMTLYLTFEAVENGQLRLDQSVRVSRKASRQPASKLYLKAGQRVTIRSLIRATAIKSANDAAMVLAETIGGSERAFAELMTAKARALGMRNTTFRNPHGLTQSGHLSTARDMAILARHVYFDFPQYYNVFGRKTDRAAGKRIYSTNRLLRSYRGAEGMKTGYTRAAGYNLVATASRGSERIIAVVLGGKSSRSRNRQVAKLLDLGFSRADSRVAIVRPGTRRIQVASAPLPPVRPGLRSTGLAALGEVAATPAAAETVELESTAPLYSIVPEGRETPSRAAIAEVRDTSRFVADAGRLGLPVPRPKPLWSVQIGAFDTRDLAVARLTSVSLGNVAALSGAPGEIDEVSGQRGKLFRVRFHGLAPGDARLACKALKTRGQDCLAIAPRG